MFPIVVNVLGTLKIYNMNVCLTPISFSIAVIFYTFAIMKFNFLKITPIALQKIVDRISDGYVVLDENNEITDLKISGNKNLSKLSCGDNKIENLDIADSENLTEFYCYNNQITTLNISNLVKLTHLYCNNNKFN